MKKSFLSGFIVVILSACGGGGGGAPFTNSDGVNNAPVSNSACRVNLVEYINDNNRRVPGNQLLNQSGQCDYLVDRSVSINASLLIEAGVTFVLTEGVSIDFDDVSIEGTAADPVRFLSAVGEGNWGQVRLGGADVSTNYAIFNGGGNPIYTTGNQAAVVVERGESDISIRHTIVSGSAGNGLSIGGYNSVLNSFKENVFQGNAGYGVVLNSWSVAGGLDQSNDFEGTADPNSKNGVHVVDSRASGLIPNIGVPYRLLESGSNSSNIRSLSLFGALVEAGVVLEIHEDMSVDVSRSTLNGTAEMPVRLTSQSDQGGAVFGGVSTDGRSVFRHVKIENGGGGDQALEGALKIGRVSSFGIDSLIVESVEIVNAQTFGVYCAASNTDLAEFSGLTITGALVGDIHSGCDFTVQDALPASAAIDVSQCTEHTIGLTTIQGPYTFKNHPGECDYLVAGDVEFGSNVLIEAGAKIVFTRGASMSIRGTLTADSSEENRTILTAEVRRSGYWSGLELTGMDNRLRYIDIEFGGVDGGAGLEVSGSRFGSDPDVSLQHVMVHGSRGHGVTITKADVTEFHNNRFIGNALHGLQLEASQLAKLDTGSQYNVTEDPNGLEGINLTSTIFDSELILNDMGEPYRLSGLSVWGVKRIVINEGVTIVVDDDAEIKLNGGAVMEVLGTDSNPVTIRSAVDQPNGWVGVVIVGGSITAVNMQLSGGGRDNPVPRTEGASLSLSRSTASLSNVSIRDSAGWAISCSGTNPNDFSFSNLTYANNALGNINPACGS